VGVAIAAGVGAAAAGPTRNASGPSAESARATYLADCATCHGSAGEGTDRGPTIAGIGRASVDYVLTTGRMPLTDPNAKVERHPPAYDPETLRALEDYVVSLGPGGTDIPAVDIAKGDIAAGGDLFRLQCAACHQWAGNGGALLHREAPPLTPATPVQVGEAVRTGPGTMPAFGTSAIDDQQLDDVAAFVEQLKHLDDRGGIPLWHLGPFPEGAVAWVAGAGVLLLIARWIGEGR
jgi:ubiquinol-cytochrome c reductase cytochrome c subunit